MPPSPSGARGNDAAATTDAGLDASGCGKEGGGGGGAPARCGQRADEGREELMRQLAEAAVMKAGLQVWPVVDLPPVTGVYATVHSHAPPPVACCRATRRR
ncbi:hypothetical protein HYH02_007558 [Chlamydomonas schloesseri]|uniref:Uncharacterized protein n=1 Tax=Chlamydomonas schloesseri TaxID=2026947 RepID=A0A835WHN4_9CHLO|nr:hypothetical protein HYH02_007558 [Chlamydomonas schloesseri]|eukprot:KAG2447640.1 hypothetical protein HYH02_007558 [Chlamydomonas schloesseri]